MAELFKRRAIVEFVSNDESVIQINAEMRERGQRNYVNGKRIEGLDVRFTIQNIGDAAMNEAQISICNLPRGDLEFLTTWEEWDRARSENKIVRLSAGYNDDVALLYEGYIVHALPTRPPDVWLNMRLLQHYEKNVRIYSELLRGNNTLKDTALYIANQLGLQLSWQADAVDLAEKIIPNFSWSGSQLDVIKQLKKLAGIDVYMEGSQLVVSDRRVIVDETNTSVRTVPPQFLSQTYSADSQKIASNAYDYEITAANGMLDIPYVDPLGVEVRMLLNNKIKRGDRILLNSEYLPSAFGIYDVFNVTHVGHLRGQQFYTAVWARRLGRHYSPDANARRLSNG